jgi:hypothetical protein
MNAAARDTVLLTIAGVIAALAAIPPGAPYRRTAIVVCLALVSGRSTPSPGPTPPSPSRLSTWSQAAQSRHRASRRHLRREPESSVPSLSISPPT